MEVFKDSSKWAYLKIYQAGSLTDAAVDGTPLGYKVTATVSLNNGTAETRSVARESAGVYKILITLSDTDLERTITVTWKFTMPAESFESTKVDQYEVITPYLSIKDAESIYAESKGWNWVTKVDQNGAALSAAQVLEVESNALMAEQYARYLINAFCNKTFGMRQKTITSYGEQSDVIVFNERILGINKVWENSNLVIDNTSNPVVNELLYGLEITESNYGIRVTDDENIDEFEVINPVYSNGIFTQGYRYDVDAVVGYNSVPSEVQLAARALITDFYCKDNAWQQKYINSISASDWRIVFDRIKYKGTGNFFADQVLAPHVYQPVVVI